MSIQIEIPLPLWAYEPPYNRMRQAKLLLFISSFSPYDRFKQMSVDQKLSLVQRLERACYNYTIARCNEENIIASWDTSLFCDTYHSICYKVSVNIDPTSIVGNDRLGGDILEGRAEIKNVPRMSSIDMFPEKHRDYLASIEASKNVELSTKTTSLYRCRKCHMNKCTVRNRYNRSFDEGVGLLVTCQNCGHEFAG